MGIWGSGPFDNDIAADWCGDLNDADARHRPGTIEAALLAAAEDADFLDTHTAQQAVAAAAVVASQCPYGPPVYTAYGPDFLLEGGTVDVDHLVPLAARALDRVVGLDSEWRELWESNNELEEALDVLAPVRATLSS